MIPVISYTNLKGREPPGGIRDLRHETKLHTDQVFLDRTKVCYKVPAAIRSRQSK
jgi:hypothetical protein